MVGAIILIGLVLGATLACAAAKFPARAVALEMCGGALLVVSLALLGGLLHSVSGCAFSPRAAWSAQCIGSEKLMAATAGPSMGGTKKLAGVHLIRRTLASAEPNGSVVESQYEIE